MTKICLAAAMALAYPFATFAWAQAAPVAPAVAASSPAATPASAEPSTTTTRTIVIQGARGGHTASDAGSAKAARVA